MLKKKLNKMHYLEHCSCCANKKWKIKKQKKRANYKQKWNTYLINEKFCWYFGYLDAVWQINTNNFNFNLYDFVVLTTFNQTVSIVAWCMYHAQNAAPIFDMIIAPNRCWGNVSDIFVSIFIFIYYIYIT